MALTGKMLAWADAWLVTYNKTEASRRAGYRGNDVTLAAIGYENFKKPQIQEYITQRLNERAMPADEVLTRLADMARSSISSFAHIQDNADLANCENGQLIKKFKRKITRTKLGDEFEEIELELYDAQAALEKLGRYHSLFKETQTNINIDLSQLTGEQLDRIASGEDPLQVINSTQGGG